MVWLLPEILNLSPLSAEQCPLICLERVGSKRTRGNPIAFRLTSMVALQIWINVRQPRSVLVEAALIPYFVVVSLN